MKAGGPHELPVHFALVFSPRAGYFAEQEPPVLGGVPPALGSRRDPYSNAVTPENELMKSIAWCPCGGQGADVCAGLRFLVVGGGAS
jgi:hypothetical protein